MVNSQQIKLQNYTIPGNPNTFVTELRQSTGLDQWQKKYCFMVRNGRIRSNNTIEWFSHRWFYKDITSALTHFNQRVSECIDIVTIENSLPTL